MTAPLVTVIIPAFNAERTIRETLASVAAQTYAPFEVVVVDDGSTDDTAGVVMSASEQSFDLRLIRTSNAGPSTARNRAIAVARGDLIAPLDADDLWHPEFLRLTVARLTEAGTEVGFVYALHQVIAADNSIQSSMQAFGCQGPVLRQHLMVNFVGNGSSALWRKRAITSVGGYDARADFHGGGEDYLLQLRVAATHLVEFVPCYLVGYRRSGVTLSSDPNTLLRSQLYVLSQRHAADGAGTDLAIRWSRAEAYRVAGFSNLKRRKLGVGALHLSIGALTDPWGFACDVSLRLRNWLKRRRAPRGLTPAAFGTVCPGEPPLHCPAFVQRRLRILKALDDGELERARRVC